MLSPSASESRVEGKFPSGHGGNVPRKVQGFPSIGRGVPSDIIVATRVSWRAKGQIHEKETRDVQARNRAKPGWTRWKRGGRHGRAARCMGVRTAASGSMRNRPGPDGERVPDGARHPLLHRSGRRRTRTVGGVVGPRGRGRVRDTRGGVGEGGGRGRRGGRRDGERITTACKPERDSESPFPTGHPS